MIKWVGLDFANLREMAKLPWISGQSSSTDLHSVSLLHSIYGSQVSQVLLVSSDVLYQDERDKNSTGRPKSSPAVNRLQQSASNPASDTVRSRPATAYFRSRSGQDRSEAILRPKSGMARRPYSALRREDLQMCSKYAIHKSKPVTLTRIPEYVNFWQGKPLSEREHNNPSHQRKVWRRPKSDYGTRFSAMQSSSSRTAPEEGTDQEVYDINITASIKNSNAKGGVSSDLDYDPMKKHKKGGSNPTCRQLSSDPLTNTRDDENRGGRADNTDGRSTVARINPNNNIWAQRSHVRRRTSTSSNTAEDSDIDGSKNIHPQDFLVDVTGSGCTTTRFELPMDTQQLEGMSPLKYLKSHCIISTHHMLLCSRLFTKYNTKKDGFLCQKDLRKALQDAAQGHMSEPQVESLLQLVHYTPHIRADRQLFAALCCLAGRMFSFNLLPLMTTKEVIEIVDFEALDWKLRGCSIGQDLQNLFKNI